MVINQNIEFCRAFYDAVAPLAMQGKMSYALHKLYAKCRDTIGGKQFFKERPFNNVIMEVKIAQRLVASKGDKMSDRYGGKGVISEVRPDALMPRLDNGKVVDDPRYGINVITAAAPNLRMFSRSLTGDDFYHMILNRIRSVIRLAKEKDQKILILGAFGCGAFRNPPEIVAKAFAQAIDEIDDGEMHFIFAIRAKNEKETRNYKIFKRVLEDEE